MRWRARLINYVLFSLPPTFSHPLPAAIWPQALLDTLKTFKTSKTFKLFLKSAAPNLANSIQASLRTRTHPSGPLGLNPSVYTDTEVVATTVGCVGAERQEAAEFVEGLHALSYPLLASLPSVITTPIPAAQPVLPKWFTSIADALRSAYGVATATLLNDGEWDTKHPPCSLLLPAATTPSRGLCIINRTPPFNANAALGPDEAVLYYSWFSTFTALLEYKVYTNMWWYYPTLESHFQNYDQVLE
ncbi:hypothetical protein DFH07DRAFT_778370 [Mycena maculata]|uniref:Uncharacterized protein n=1 Tax=Mycena maculata TaxID=230809 RepID=A0AAD7ID66_9AGAR|nr:hypothetical protein DFH07DRAFT_778370 [Mycena maculata]